MVPIYKKCGDCPQIKGHKSVGARPVRTTIGSFPFQYLMVDFVGPITPPTMFRGRKCKMIATCIALLPRWCWFCPLPNGTAEEFCEFLWYDVCLDEQGGYKKKKKGEKKRRTFSVT